MNLKLKNTFVQQVGNVLKWCIGIGLMCLIWFGPLAAMLHRSNTPEPTPREELAGSVTGEWEMMGGTVILDLDDHGAVFDKSVTNDKKIESRGKWSTTENTVEVHANGQAGSFDLTLEYTEGDQVDILSPLPKASAHITDCFFRTHETSQDDDYEPDPDS